MSVAARKDPNLTDKLAAIILAHYSIPHDVASNLSRGEILSLVDWDHYPVPFAVARDLGWTPDRYNHPSNLVAMLRDDHAVKTAKRDIPEIAKGDRITDAHRAFQRKVLAKAGVATEPDSRDRKLSRWGSSRRMTSRPFPKRIKRGEHQG